MAIALLSTVLTVGPNKRMCMYILQRTRSPLILAVTTIVAMPLNSSELIFSSVVLGYGKQILLHIHWVCLLHIDLHLLVPQCIYEGIASQESTITIFYGATGYACLTSKTTDYASCGSDSPS
ncbi:hypothetical protein E2C01_057823 [Portunus trituberculatus]|uniref:Uncharacterized protein n=1 Tax=Portunus trituberculatus TaxID=210409 RepID=A0A5B7GU08_PORTR|nr:hypothetical protein [Portunus trituberculatus]